MNLYPCSPHQNGQITKFTFFDFSDSLMMPSAPEYEFSPPVNVKANKEYWQNTDSNNAYLYIKKRKSFCLIAKADRIETTHDRLFRDFWDFTEHPFILTDTL